jgi:hypothetical protein
LTYWCYRNEWSCWTSVKYRIIEHIWYNFIDSLFIHTECIL